MISTEATKSTFDRMYMCAVDLFAERGYHGTSMRALAEAVGVKESSLYHHVPSKQVLLVSIMERTLGDLYDSVAVAAEQGNDAAAELALAVRAHIRFHAERRREAFVTDSELRALSEDNYRKVVALRDALQRLYEETLRRGVETGSLRVTDVKMVANAMLTSSTDVGIWFRPDGRLSADEVADHYLALFFDGLRNAGTPRTLGPAAGVDGLRAKGVKRRKP